MAYKVTMHQAIFYQLWKIKKSGIEADYMPIWKLIGEVHVTEMDAWGFVSYEVSARMSELFAENPDLFERRTTTGKSGSTYYEYRIRNGAKLEDFKGERLRLFYLRLNHMF